MFEKTIIIGVISSFYYYEIVGILPGGIIVPGYLAFFIQEQPLRVLLTVLSALISFFIVKYIISRYLFVYGVRRFFLMITVNYATGNILIANIEFLPVDLTLAPIGFLIGGIIANNFAKQGIAITLINMTGAVILIRLIIIALNLI